MAVYLLTTTVTVDDEIRRKLKRLAAMLDATQGDVIERALSLYEDQVLGRRSQRKIPNRVLEAMNEASSKIRQSDPEWARISRRIEGATIPVEVSISATWGREL